jgi:anaerobic magnesium-protoporphyrin IX monomethyl ester cyclase
MKVLLFSMPDSFEHMPTVAIRMPNGALTSLAGNVDSHHRVAVADLVLVQDRVRETVERLVQEYAPDVAGLSVMTFQRVTAARIIELLRRLKPDARIVVGGYDPSLAPEEYERMPGVEFIVRGEGEITFRELLRALESGSGFDKIQGLSYRCQPAMETGNGKPETPLWRRNADRGVHPLESGEIALPNRGARVLGGYTMLGRPVDVVETSRGCTYDCSFCSIIEMRGRNFHTYSFERVLADIRDARAHGARTIFLVDDNITLNIRRFQALCQAIIDARLNQLDFIVQAMTSAIATHGAVLAPLMRRAGFRYVFLGIENILDGDLAFLKAAAKNADREAGKTIGNASIKAIEHLHRNGMLVAGGLIVGNPGDTPESIEANLEFARRYVDWPYIQHPTPYPRTPMTRDFRQRGLIVNEHPEQYDGTTAVVRTEHLAADEIEYLRWRAERWMKTRHFPRVLMHDPWFALRHARRMFAHTYRGSSWKSVLGLESDRKVFERYQTLRQRERTYL